MNLVNYASAGPLVDPTTAVLLVNPATAGPLIDAYITVQV